MSKDSFSLILRLHHANILSVKLRYVYKTTLPNLTIENLNFWLWKLFITCLQTLTLWQQSKTRSLQRVQHSFSKLHRPTRTHPPPEYFQYPRRSDPLSSAPSRVLYPPRPWCLSSWPGHGQTATMSADENASSSAVPTLNGKRFRPYFCVRKYQLEVISRGKTRLLQELKARGIVWWI